MAIFIELKLVEAHQRPMSRAVGLHAAGACRDCRSQHQTLQGALNIRELIRFAQVNDSAFVAFLCLA